jgi:hypothetical protein
MLFILMSNAIFLDQSYKRGIITNATIIANNKCAIDSASALKWTYTRLYSVFILLEIGTDSLFYSRSAVTKSGT